MTPEEHSNLARVCRDAGYPDLAAYHERRAHQTRRHTDDKDTT